MKLRNCGLVAAIATALALGAVAQGSSQSPERPQAQICVEIAGFVDIGNKIVNKADIVFIEEGSATAPAGGHVVRIIYRQGGRSEGTRTYKDVREDLLR